MRVTFDSNTLDKVARPERFPKDPRQSDYFRVRNAIKLGKIDGYFPEVAITLEGVQNKDRIDVFGSTRLEMQGIKTSIGDDGTVVNEFKSILVQERKPLHPENLARMYAALTVGMRALRGPARVAWIRVNDPDRIFFADQDDDPLMPQRVEAATQAVSVIEERGLGNAIVQSIGIEFSTRDGIAEPWFHGIRRARDELERKRVQRAIAEWADADGVAAHIGYANDLFCTGDFGKTAGLPSIFDLRNRAWLLPGFAVTGHATTGAAPAIH